MALGLGTLKRLVAVFELMEEQAASSLQKSVSETVRAKNAVDRESDILRSSVCDFEHARVSGDLLGATVASAGQDVAERRQGAFEKILEQRKRRSAEAKKNYKAHRVKLEQMRRLLEDANSRSVLEMERKEQGLADDRFLAARRVRRFNSEHAD